MGVGGTFAFQAEFVEQLTVLQLVVLDSQIDTLVRVAENGLRRDGFFIPSELSLQVETVFVGEHKGVADRLAGDAGGDGNGICFGVLPVCGGHLECAGLR